ncbi:MAG: hypothetical protein JKY54_02680 [Flavobacteriales bacterium]|nr:hypothetical protein [Flavobacteriales bacterium]
MSKKLLGLFAGLFLVVTTNAQGDVCATATALGTLPSPSACPTGGAGSTLTFNGTTIGATAENPYSSLTCMDAPAADVWVSFVASGMSLILAFHQALRMRMLEFIQATVTI